jgi:hypothetical protein
LKGKEKLIVLFYNLFIYLPPTENTLPITGGFVMMAFKRTKLEEDEIAFIVAEEESDDEVKSEVSEVEDVCDTDDSVWDVIPVSVSEPDNSTDDDRNNNNFSMEDGNGNNGYSENLVSI